jgi:hypothetical protein
VAAEGRAILVQEDAMATAAVCLVWRVEKVWASGSEVVGGRKQQAAEAGAQEIGGEAGAGPPLVPMPCHAESGTA